MRVAVVTHVRLVREALARSLARSRPTIDSELLNDVEALGRLVRAVPARLSAALVDVSHRPDLGELRAFRDAAPQLPLIAFGLREQEAEVLACIRAGFVGFVSREDGADQLRQKVREVIEGRPSCPPEIILSLMHRYETQHPGLTSREADVHQLAAEGCSNKEIARKLGISESTARTHLRSIFGKLRVSRRAELTKRFGFEAGERPRIAESRLGPM